MTTAELIGRDEESEVVDLLVGHITDGGDSLLIRGEPGIGKSALLERARRQATAIGAQTLTGRPPRVHYDSIRESHSLQSEDD